MFARIQLLLFVACASGWQAATAESVFVIDKLLVGIHESKATDSAILKVVPTGTALEVLKREGDFAYVSEAGGIKGWVDGSYLVTAPPAQIRIDALEKDKAGLEQRIKQLQQPSRGDGFAAPPADNTQLDVLMKENTELKGKLSDEKLRAGTLQTEAAGLRALVKNTAVPPDARLVELERSRDDLQQDLEDARKKLAEYAARESQDDIAALVPLVLREYKTTLMILVLVLAALSFAAGVYVVDLLNRRRHGGFRV